MKEYYIVSVKHTKREDEYITFWRPDDRGYCWALSNAGRYSEDSVKAHLGYYNTGCDIAVSCDAVDTLGIAPIPGHHDNDTGPVVANSLGNWKKLQAAVIDTPKGEVKAQYKRQRKIAI